MQIMTGARARAEHDERKRPVTIPARRQAEGGAARVVVERRDDGRVSLLIATARERVSCVLSHGEAGQVADAAREARGEVLATGAWVPPDGLPPVVPGRGPRCSGGRPVMPAALHSAWCGFARSVREQVGSDTVLMDCVGCGSLVEHRTGPGPRRRPGGAA